MVSIFLIFAILISRPRMSFLLCGWSDGGLSKSIHAYYKSEVGKNIGKRRGTTIGFSSWNKYIIKFILNYT